MRVFVDIFLRFFYLGMFIFTIYGVVFIYDREDGYRTVNNLNNAYKSEILYVNFHNFKFLVELRMKYCILISLSLRKIVWTIES